MGERVSGRVKDQTKGGFLDDLDVEVVGARFEISSFDGDEGPVRKTQAIVEVEVEGREEPVPIFLSVGSAENIVPCDEDGNEVEDGESGQFLCGANGKELKGVSDGSAWGKFKAQLVVKCKFPDGHFDLAIEDALTGLKGHTTSLPGGKYRNNVGRPVTVFQSIEKDSIPSGEPIPKKKKGKKKLTGKAKPKPADDEEDEEEEDEPAPKKKTGTKVKPKPKAKDDDDEEEDDDAEEEEDDADESDDSDREAAVGKAIVKAVKKGALTKGKLGQAIGKVFADEDDKSEYVKLTMSDKFLKAGAKEGLWSYDGREVGPPEADDDEEDE